MQLLVSLILLLVANADVAFGPSALFHRFSGRYLKVAPSSSCRSIGASSANDRCDVDASCLVGVGNLDDGPNGAVMASWVHPQDGRLFVNGTSADPYGGQNAFCMSIGDTPVKGMVCHCYESSDEESWSVTRVGPKNESVAISLGPGGLSKLCLAANAVGESDFTLPLQFANCNRDDVLQWWEVQDQKPQA